MNKRSLQNDELDRLGRKLLDAGRARDEEIERIVSSPMLFEAVKGRIEIERRRERGSKRSFAGRANIQFWSWQKITAAVLLLFIVGAIGLIGFNNLNGRPPKFEQVAAPEIQPTLERNEITPVSPIIQTSKDSPVIVKAKTFAAASPKIAERKVFTGKPSKARKPNQPQKIQPEQNKPAGEFYALTFAENAGEAGEELRIVRAELSRSSLFALGVNLPIENESEKIKTDLLVGADGVARAIRLVD